MRSWWISLVVLFVLRCLQLSAAKGAKVTKDSIVFDVPGVWYGMLAGAAGLGLAFGLFAKQARPWDGPMVLWAGTLVLAALKPRAVSITDHALILPRLFGRPRVIVWSEVAGIEEGNAGDIYINTAQGGFIFSRYLVGRGLFEGEVMKRAGLRPDDTRSVSEATTLRLSDSGRRGD